MTTARLLIGLAAACAAGCATALGGQAYLREERVRIEAPRGQLLAAVDEAGTRMGWRRASDATQGVVRFVGTPAPPFGSEITASVDADGALVLAAPDELVYGREDARVVGIGVAARLLLQATEQVLDPAKTRRDARPVEARSPVAALALDLLLPAAGAAYASPGDPYRHGETVSWSADLFTRSIWDLSGAAMIAIGLLGGVSFAIPGSPSPPANEFVAAGLVAVVLNRAVSAWQDWARIQDRNALSASGFKFRLQRDPLQYDPDF